MFKQELLNRKALRAHRRLFLTVYINISCRAATKVWENLQGLDMKLTLGFHMG